MIGKPASCIGCPLYGDGSGFVPADGSGRNGVLLVFEAAGEHEAAQGKPLVGKAGFSFHRMLQRAGLRREDFRIHNVLSCRPPGNRKPLPEEMLRCAPNLDATIAAMRPKVIVAGGDTALQRLLPELHDKLRNRPKKLGLLDARGYVHWSARYQCWVIATVHPSFIMRGQTAYESVFIRDLRMAVEVAKGGYQHLDLSHFLLDPTPDVAMEWARRFEIASACDPELWLAIDDETPWKDEDEEELEGDEEEQRGEVVITRMGYSYGGGREVMSIPWGGSYEAVHRRLLKTHAPKVAWNKGHDEGDIRALGYELNGAIHDGMIAWHVLHSDLRKKLGFVTPFLIPQMPMWKHLNYDDPSFYNACDAFAEDRNMVEIVKLLKKHGLWNVYERHVVRLDAELSKMSARGMPIDPQKRLHAALLLDAKLREVRARMQAAVPDEWKPIQPKEGYVREPKDKTGLVEVVIGGVEKRRCSACGLENPRKDHFTRATLPREGTPGRKKADRIENPCRGAEVVTVVEGTRRWARRLPFVPSPVQIADYARRRKHRLPSFKGKVTTNEKAILKMIGKYPDDPLYPIIIEFRGLQKIASVYVGYPEAQGQRIPEVA